MWSGGGTYDHTEVVETDTEVLIRVLIRHRQEVGHQPVHVETLERRRAVVEVRLAAPLGGRTLVGAAEKNFVGQSGWILAHPPPIEVVVSSRTK
jgi:hypothetical protein